MRVYWPSSITARRLRWALPAGVAAAIAVASLTAGTAASGAAEPNLPVRTAAQLLAAAETAQPHGFSGTIVETANLGLPQLPQIGDPSGGDASLSINNLITGAHTLRIWYAGPTQQRLALLGRLSESDVVHHGTDLWTYTSTNRRVTHTTLPKPDADTSSDHLFGPAEHLSGLTPQQAAEKALHAIDPSTAVQVDRTARVAGRAAYQLLLVPKDTRSLIGSVRIAVDARTWMPLRVQVFARGANSPAIQVGFTDVSFTVPDASVFHFVPPAGSTIVQGSPLSDLGNGGPGPSALVPGRHHASQPATGQPTQAPSRPANSAYSKVLGSGWTAVIETKMLGQSTSSGPSSGPSIGDVLNRIATPVKGGRLVTSALLSVFIADDGEVFAGPVSPAAIQQVAATGHGL